LLVTLRLLQGLSAGGEAAGAATFIAEYTPPEKRAFYSSWLNISFAIGALVGAGLAFLIAAVVSQEALNAWGWRIPFFLAGPLGLVGLYLRLKIEDSPDFKLIEASGEVSSMPLIDMVRGGNFARMLMCGGLAVTWGVAGYMILAFMPNYMSTTVGFTETTAFLGTSIALLSVIVALPITAYLSDRIGRKPIVIAVSTGFIILAYPIFLMVNQGNSSLAIIAHILLGGLLGGYAGAPFMAMVELFPTRIRYSSYAVSYNIALASLGGTAPFIATWLVSVTGNPLSPAFYLMFAAALSLVAILFTEERAGQPLSAITNE
jgi:MHS family proline/betaine transporter-like MFS transporter